RYLLPTPKMSIPSNGNKRRVRPTFTSEVMCVCVKAALLQKGQRAAEQRQSLFAKCIRSSVTQKYPEDDSLAAPRLRKFLRVVTQGSQSLALGLALIAASQLLRFAWLLQREFLKQNGPRAICLQRPT